jgi:methionine synthase I (cobalamin-dependent)
MVEGASRETLAAAMSRFLQALRSGTVLLMDGAMGTQLQRAGVRAGECFEDWNRSHPEKVAAVHGDYVRSGARCLVTNTFQANPIALARWGLDANLEEIIDRGVMLARREAGAAAFVLASIGPMEVDKEPISRVIRAMSHANGILFETWSSPDVLAAVEVAMTICGPIRQPVLLSLACRRDGDGLDLRLARTRRARGPRGHRGDRAELRPGRSISGYGPCDPGSS